jgi:capsular polysaccharide biosynthesis protein
MLIKVVRRSPRLARRVLVASRRRSTVPPSRRPLPPVYGTTLREFVSGPVEDVVLLCGGRPVQTANELANRFPGATVHLLAFRPLDEGQLGQLTERVRYAVCRDYEERAEYLFRVPQPQLLVDIGGNRQRMLRRFRQLFAFLPAAGVYVLDYRRGPDARVGDRLSELEGLTDPSADASTAWNQNLRDSCQDVRFQDGLALVRKRLDHRIKLRDVPSTEILTARYGDAWGGVIARRPALEYVPRMTVTTHGDRGTWYGQIQQRADPSRIRVPPLSLRRYTHAICWPEQRVARDNYWLPETFRHPYDRELRHRNLVRASSRHARLPDNAPAQTRHVDGPVFYFDTEYPNHFGHVLTEVVSRYWGWRHVVAIEPDIRPLVSLHRDGIPMAAFERTVFEALGIDPGRIEFIAPNEAVIVDDLYAATPMFENPRYASPEVRDPWRRIAAALNRTGAPTPKRLFVTRARKSIRTCLNTEQVEAFFAELGFEVIRPEHHDFAEQVTMFANAAVIAGFSGSNMFNAMFAPNATLIAITANTFTANNEMLIAAVNGSDLHTVIGDAEIQHPEGRWTWPAYQSNFTVDLDRLGPGICAALREHESVT